MERTRLGQAALWMVAALWLVNGCAGNLSTYEAKDPEEAMIKDLLVKWQTTYNNGDVPGNLSVWHADARIMHGMERRLATKKEYVDILPERMKANPKVKLDDPESDTPPGMPRSERR